MTAPTAQADQPNESRADALADWAEAITDLPDSVSVIRGEGEAPGRAMLIEAFGSERAVDRAIGRPALGGRGAGGSPVRQVRLPRELDEALVARAAGSNATVSEVLREALREYLDRETA